jgi:hypothetical protein
MYLVFLTLPSSAAEKKSQDLILAEKLRSELNFNLQRRKGFQKSVKDHKIFDQERENGLSLFLEEQEKFDQNREKSLYDYKRKKTNYSMDESSPEYFADLKKKKNRQKWLDDARQQHVETRDKVLSAYNHSFQNQTEAEELDLYNTRPRFDLRKRYNNKWKNQKSNAGSTTINNSFSGAPAPAPTPAPDNYPQPIDYTPQPLDNFDEIPPPPPPILYDQSQGYENGFGDPPDQLAPPPAPEGGWDF